MNERYTDTMHRFERMRYVCSSHLWDGVACLCTVNILPEFDVLDWNFELDILAEHPFYRDYPATATHRRGTRSVRYDDEAEILTYER